MPCTYEWSIAGPLGKFFYVFLANGRWAFPAMSLNRLSIKDTGEAWLWATAWITISLLRLAIFDRKKIKESYERTKNDPNLIQKLSDMVAVIVRNQYCIARSVVVCNACDTKWMRTKGRI